MLNFLKKSQANTNAFTSRLFDEKSFYTSFIRDLSNCKQEVIIESPFISLNRMKYLLPVFEKLIRRNISVFVMTRDPSILEEPLSSYSEEIIRQFEILGVQVLATSNQHHRKLAILDRKILWEGSLNILSQTKSREIMRRIEGEGHAQEMFDFLRLEQFI
jgi:phosphatidylserine/phosphatidylglycerophosphate/cardiolipin synthase-like enzyme